MNRGLEPAERLIAQVKSDCQSEAGQMKQLGSLKDYGIVLQALEEQYWAKLEERRKVGRGAPP